MKLAGVTRVALASGVASAALGAAAGSWLARQAEPARSEQRAELALLLGEDVPRHGADRTAVRNAHRWFVADRTSDEVAQLGKFMNVL